MDYVPALAAGVAGIAVVVAAAVHGAAAAVAAPAVGAVMYPDDDDGDDNDDPEGLIVGKEAVAAVTGHAVAVVVAVGVHRRDSLLDRFLTPYYSGTEEV